MKHFLGLALITTSIIVGAEPSQKLSFVQAQAAALAYSEELSIAEIETLTAREKIEEIRGINLPKLSLDGTGSFRNNEPGFIRRNPAYDQQKAKPVSPNPSSPAEPIPPRPPKHLKTIAAQRQGASGKLSLIVPIYDFGVVSNMMRAQTSVVSSTLHEKDRIQQDVLFAVANSFYRALEGSKIENVLAESMKVLNQQLATAKDLYSVGLVTQNDVLVVEVQLAQRQQESIQAKHNIESALSTLSRLTGKNVTTVEEIEDVSDAVTWNETVDTIISRSDVAHPVLKKILANIDAATFEYEATKAENYPDIKAFMNYNTSTDKYMWHKKWVQTGVCIDIPIIDGGIVNSRLAQKRHQLSALDLRYTEALRNIHLEIQRSFFNVDSAFLQIPVAKKSIHLAEENLAISRDLFDEGFIMSDDVLSDEERLAQARSNYYQALYSFYIARSGLEYAAGLIQMEGANHVGSSVAT